MGSRLIQKRREFQVKPTVIANRSVDFELALAQAQADRMSAESNYQLTKAQSEAAISNYAILNPA